MLRTNAEIVKRIKEEIIKKYDSYPYSFNMEYHLKKIKGNQVEVRAWQNKYNSTINEVKFIVVLSKRLMIEKQLRTPDKKKDYKWKKGELELWLSS